MTCNQNMFPLGLAIGENFCNRETEQAHLKANISTASPTLITSPRRYGKTSLVFHVIKQLNIPFSHIDLYAEFDELSVQNAILSRIGDILYMLESGTKKALQFVTAFFSGLNVSFTFEGMQVKVEIAKSRKIPAKVIMSALEDLDQVLNKKKKKIILFFDEFQKLSQISQTSSIEGTLRHIAQKSQNICFIFSGSNRHLLSKMFEDSSKPFYNLCDRIILGRISSQHYGSFIQKKAKLTWGTELGNGVIELILELTQRHPYYLNALCHRLWRKKELLSEAKILDAWNNYTQERKSDISAELDLLSENQIKMLISLAKYGVNYSPMSKEFISITKFSLSSASMTIKALLQLDYIYAAESGKYRLIDPVIEYLFKI
jgi:uncharacterized protein